jgi:hypothetical protein
MKKQDEPTLILFFQHLTVFCLLKDLTGYTDEEAVNCFSG